MKRAPMAVVVTILTASSPAGRPYSRHRDERRICIVTGGEFTFARLFLKLDFSRMDCELKEITGPGYGYDHLSQVSDIPGLRGETWGAQILLLVGGGSVESVEFLAGLEADGFAGGDADFGAGSGVAADACFTGADAEDAEAAQLDAIPRSQRLLEPFEDGVHGGFRFSPRQACPLDDVMDDILFDQCVSPRLKRI